MDKKIILLTPRGFCAGVVRAIDVVKIALDLYGAPIYVRKEIVHNRHVVDELRGAGAIFVEELDEVPEGRARDFQRPRGFAGRSGPGAASGSLQVIDATCPLVTKVHLEAVKFAKKGYTIVLIGHKDHDEVIGTLGEAPESTVLVSTVEDVDRLEVKDPERVSYHHADDSEPGRNQGHRGRVCRSGSRRFRGRRRRISAMPRKTGSLR